MSEQTAFKLKGTVPADPSGIQTRRPDGTHRVVITGMGAISPAGVGVEALWDAVYGKKCCIDTIRGTRCTSPARCAISIPPSTV